MNQMQAGLPNQRGDVVGDLVLGDFKPFRDSTKLTFRDDSGRWLKTGVLLPWESAFTPLLKDHRGLALKEHPMTSQTAAFNAPTWMKQFFVGGNYVYVGGDRGNTGNNYAQAGNTVAVGTDLKSQLTANGLRASSADVIGNNVVVVGISGGSNAGVVFSASGGAFATMGGPGSTDSFAYIASNKTNLMILGKQASNIQTAGAIHTTTNGSSSTARTAGGATGLINGLYWSPCSSAFLAVAGQTLNVAADGYTYSVCSLPASVTALTTPFTVDDYTSKKCASSSTSTIILLTDGRYLRTTNGTNFAAFDPGLLYAANLSGGWIIHDGARYIWCIQATTQNGRPTFLVSEDDGLTFAPSISWGSTSLPSSNTTNVQLNQMSVANNRLLWAVPAPTAGDLRLIWDVTGMISFATIPDKVGLIESSAVGSGSSLTYYVRIAQ